MGRWYERLYSVGAYGLLLLLMGSNVGAAEGGKGQGSLVWPIVNFGIFIVVLCYFLLKPARMFLLNRRNAIKSAIDEAHHAQERAEAKYREYEAKLSQVTKEAEEIIAALAKEGEREKERIIANAEKLAEKMKEEIHSATIRELEKARIALKEEIARLSLQAAEQLLQDTISERDHERLVKDYIQKMKEIH